MRRDIVDAVMEECATIAENSVSRDMRVRERDRIADEIRTAKADAIRRICTRGPWSPKDFE